jgi:hypothetical protein
MAGIGVIGTVISAVGSIASGMIGAQAAQAQAAAMNQSLKYQNLQHEINKDIALANAQEKQQDTMKRLRYARSQLRARSAASGFGYGSEDTRAFENKMLAEGWDLGHRQLAVGLNEGENIKTQIGINKIQMQANTQAAKYSALGSIIGGFGSAFGGLASLGGGQTGAAQYYAQNNPYTGYYGTNYAGGAPIPTPRPYV